MEISNDTETIVKMEKNQANPVKTIFVNVARAIVKSVQI